jgi:propanol-preferring alcohol dehydrogenase
MRAAVLDGPGRPLRIERVAIPAPGPGQILLRLEASGVCHTDVHVWQGEAVPPEAPDPFIPGHEGVGRVAAIGPGVAGWAVGDRAGAAWTDSCCGACAECRGGHESFCQAQRAHGFHLPGTFAEYVLCDAAFAPRLPEGDALQLAPLMCAGLTALGAVERAGLRLGETCAVVGCGGLGLYAVQIAARAGARVVAVDTDAGKLALARDLGAHDGVLAQEGWGGRAKADAVLNFAPTPRSWPLMCEAVRPLGRIVAAAMVQEAVGLDQEWLTYTGVTITGTSVGSRAQMARLLALHAERPFRTEVTEAPLEGATAALRALAEGRVRGRTCLRL